MTMTATVFMLTAMALIWGGLIVSTIHLMKNPDKSYESLGLDE